MEIQEILHKVGLTEKETEVYLAVLELGNATGYAIAKKANIKRPTAYMVLEALEQKRLIHRVLIKSKALFTAESPEVLLRDLTKKTELAKRGLPYLLALFNAKKEKPQIQLFQGKENIKEAIDKIPFSGMIRSMGHYQEVLAFYPEIAEPFINAVRGGQVIVRDLLTDPKIDANNIKIYKDLLGYQMRMMHPPKNINSDFALFGNSVLLFSYHPEMFALLITSEDIAGMFEAMFDQAWQTARPV